jgi:hypothetical protein
MGEKKVWSPPFCVRDEPNRLKCPKCGGKVRIREEEFYRDGDEVEAYCGKCHAALTVRASVDISFLGPPDLEEA